MILVLTVVGAAIMGTRRGFPGPGASDLAWHIGAAVLIVIAQVFADRRQGVAAFSGCAIVFAVAGMLLWTQWWN
ncbi:hypothetical protein ACFVUS_34290 [Nocardia sp. NPDC058058]|uniref:hypothetical protein n=1 Tax=Nocardia sp. NPDC058058 TaxID=3346317 RepID=UPI0036D95295